MKARPAVLCGLVVAATVLVTLGIAALGDEPSPTSAMILAPIAAGIAAVFVVVAILARSDRARRSAPRGHHRGAHHRVLALLGYSNDVVVLTDAGGRITFVSPGVTAVVGGDESFWHLRPVTDLVASDSRVHLSAELDTLVRSGRDATVEFRTVLERRDGTRGHTEVVMVNLIEDDAIGGVVVTFRDLSDQHDLELRLNHRAFHDELTGLANRAMFLERMSQVLDPDHIGGMQPVMVLFIDLDDFKAVNDQHGHAVGDQLLRAIAQRVRGAGGSGDLVARLGGDEFSVLLEGRGGIDRAIDVAERVLDELARPLELGAIRIEVHASIGIAVAPTGTTTTSVMRDADYAMYEAKRAGKGQIRIFDPTMRETASRHLAYRGELATAVDGGQLRIVFLPFVDLTTGVVRGAEALVRWNHPLHGEVSPFEFVPIAARSGLMVSIGRWVLGEALDELGTWGDRPAPFVSVNLSGPELVEPDVVEYIERSLTDRHLDASRLVVEVTEDALSADSDRSATVVRELRALGVRVALDDFGAGAMALGFLREHPVDLLKIDRTVVRELHQHRSGEHERAAGLSETIVRMAALLGVQAVAEGIEAPDQLRSLRAMGCDLGQGHLLSAPLETDVARVRFGGSTAAPVR